MLLQQQILRGELGIDSPSKQASSCHRRPQFVCKFLIFRRERVYYVKLLLYFATLLESPSLKSKLTLLSRPLSLSPSWKQDKGRWSLAEN